MAEDARNALRWLNSNRVRLPWITMTQKDSTDEVESDINKTLQQIMEARLKIVDSIPWKTCLTSGEILKPTFTAFLVMLMYPLSGSSVLTFYTLEIFQASGNLLMDPKIAIVIVSALQSLAGLPAYFVVDKYGRKIFYLSFYVVMAISTLVLAAFFCLKDTQPEILAKNVWLEIVPLISVTAFFMAFCWGLGNISFITVSEVLPSQVVGVGSAVCSIIFWGGMFVTTQLFQMYIEIIPIQVWFIGFAGVSIVGGLFTIFCLPETKGLTLEEIQAFYSSSRGTTKGAGNAAEI